MQVDSDYSLDEELKYYDEQRRKQDDGISEVYVTHGPDGAKRCCGKDSWYIPVQKCYDHYTHTHHYIVGKRVRGCVMCAEH